MAYGTVATDTIKTSATGKKPTFQDSNGTSVGALCLAWVNFTSTGAITASFNVSSVTKNGTGDFTANFANALTDANYAPIGCCRAIDTNIYPMNIHQSTAPSTTSVRVRTSSQSATITDNPANYLAIFGN